MIRFEKVPDPEAESSDWDSGWRFCVAFWAGPILWLALGQLCGLLWMLSAHWSGLGR